MESLAPRSNRGAPPRVAPGTLISCQTDGTGQHARTATVRTPRPDSKLPTECPQAERPCDWGQDTQAYRSGRLHDAGGQFAEDAFENVASLAEHLS